jgi:hypothetical protein
MSNFYLAFIAAFLALAIFLGLNGVRGPAEIASIRSFCGYGLREKLGIRSLFSSFAKYASPEADNAVSELVRDATCKFRVYDRQGNVVESSAFLISSDGLAATCFHCAVSFTGCGFISAELVFEGKDGTELSFPVEHVEVFSETLDLAVVKSTAVNRHYLSLGCSNGAKVGDEVQLAARGVVHPSAFLKTKIIKVDSTSFNLKQFNIYGAAVRGFSGCPVLIREDNVLGVFSSAYFDTNIGCIVPSEYLSSLLQNRQPKKTSIRELNDGFRHRIIRNVSYEQQGIEARGEEPRVYYEKHSNGVFKLKHSEGLEIVDNADGRLIVGQSASLYSNTSRDLFCFGQNRITPGSKGFEPPKGVAALYSCYGAKASLELGNITPGWRIGLGGSLFAQGDLIGFRRVFSNDAHYAFWTDRSTSLLGFLDSSPFGGSCAILDIDKGTCEIQTSYRRKTYPINAQARFIMDKSSDGVWSRLIDVKMGVQAYVFKTGGMLAQYGKLLFVVDNQGKAHAIDGNGICVDILKESVSFCDEGSNNAIRIYANTGTAIAGEHHEGIFNGLGAISWADGNIYAGKLVNGAPWGFGALYDSFCKELYIGSFAKGCKHGSGSVFNGDYKATNVMHENGALKHLLHNCK